MKKRIVLLLLFLLLLAGTASAEGSLLQDFVLLLPQIRSSQTLPVGSGAILRHADGENFRYNFPDGDVYFQHSGTGSARWLLPLQTVTVRRANSDGTWYVVRNPRRFSAQSTVFLETEGLHLVLSPPMAYRPMEHDCLQAVPQLDGQVTLTRQADGFLLELSHPEGEATWQWYLLASSQRLVPWSSSQRLIWPGYDMTGQYRFCQKGFYQLSPESYDPTGDGVYFLNPASYIPAKFITTGGSRAADKLGIAMLDMARRSLEGRGYIPISTQSAWLQTDFAIGHGYYDTRWSTDLGLALAAADEKFDLPDFREDVHSMGDYLRRHIAENGFVLPGKTRRLSPDYSWPGDYKVPHCSLNHALAEVLLLHKAGFRAEAQDLTAALAEADWLRPDGNLKYGLLPDGSEIGTDYPYLTYNDLVLLRRYCREQGLQFPRELEALITAKHEYMVKHGITGYLPYVN